MTHRLDKGIELLDERPGSGPAAARGATVTYSARFYLRRGDEVTTDHASIAAYGERVPTRVVEGTRLIEHTTVLGRRQPIAGVEKTLHGMAGGGYREVLVAPHLGYGAAGVPHRVPPNAMLRLQVWVHRVDPGRERD